MVARKTRERRATLACPARVVARRREGIQMDFAELNKPLLCETSAVGSLPLLEGCYHPEKDKLIV